MIVVLAGGVGGAKLAHGLAMLTSDLTVVVNTADDFDLYGLRICPDLDTVMYTLAGLANPETGWGLAGDTFTTLDMLTRYGEEPWFRLGDKDFATHILRTQLLREGWSLTRVTRRLALALGVAAGLLPMSDDPVATLIETPDGPLDFQEYFVRRRHSPEVIGVAFQRIAEAAPSPQVLEALRAADLIVFAPSNPFVSIGPILQVPGLEQAVRESPAPKVAVSPIVGGQALKGPAAAMLTSLGREVSAYGVAELYQGLIEGFVLDSVDRQLVPRVKALDMHVFVAEAVMHTDEDRRRLAEEVVDFGRSLKVATIV